MLPSNVGHKVFVTHALTPKVSRGYSRVFVLFGMLAEVGLAFLRLPVLLASAGARFGVACLVCAFAVARFAVGSTTSRVSLPYRERVKRQFETTCFAGFCHGEGKEGQHRMYCPFVRT